MSFTHPQFDKDRYRVILITTSGITSGTEILLVRAANSFTLPEVEIPAFERVAENLRGAMRKVWDQDILCLSMLLPESEAAPRYFAAEVLREEAPTHNCVWVQVASLEPSFFAHSTDLQALRRWLALGTDVSTKYNEGPFAKPGWFEEVRVWVASMIEPFGLSLTGAFRQLNASPTFSLLRFATNGPAVWFKAVGEPNLREFGIARELAQFFPNFVPSIVAVRHEWHAWLILDVEGAHPDENSHSSVWTRVARALAELQLASHGRAFHLIDAGCHDLRASRLDEAVDPFLHAMADLMGQQTKELPAPLSRTDLAMMGERLHEALASCQELEIPNTVGHLDLNPGNILVSDSRCVFLDWAEGCVGHPFLTFQYFVEHLRRLHPSDQSWQAELVSAYTQNWRSFIDQEKIRLAMKMAPLLAVFAHAVARDAWCDPVRRTHPTTAKHLRSLTRRMKREADRWAAELSDWSMSCRS